MGPDDDKRRLLADLTRALDRLSQQLGRQHDNAQRITMLAAQAEQIAERAVALNRLKPRDLEAATDSLVADIKAFAEKVAEAVERAGREVLLGRQVAEAIKSHARQTAEIAQTIDCIPDVATLRDMLRPLVTTLALLPERMQANRAMLTDVDDIGHAASGLAEQAQALADDGTRFNQAAIALGRSLRHFADHAAEVSLKMQRDTRMAIEVVEAMAGQTADLANEPRPAATRAVSADALSWLAVNKPSPDVPPAAAPARDTPACGAVAAIPANRSRRWLS